MIKRKKKIGCETPEYRCNVSMPYIKPPKTKEFENAQDMSITPKHDKISTWEDSAYVPYKDEITIAYNDIKVIYKLGDGIHTWKELQEMSLEEVLSGGCICCDGGINRRYKINLKFFPERIM
jgi:hypothetical protein